MREYILREILVLGVAICFIGASVSVVATGGVDNLKNGMNHWFISKYHDFRLSDVSHRDTHRLSHSMDTSISDAPVEEWNKTFGGTESDCGKTVMQTSDGGYIIAGNTASYTNDESDVWRSDIWLIKTDSDGNMVWNKTIGGPFYDDVHSMKETEDGGYILAGCTSLSPEFGESTYGWVVKLDSNGSKLWDKTFGYTSLNEFFSVEETNDGGYILVGYAETFTRSYILVVKVDENGSELWGKTFSKGSFSVGEDVRQTIDGGYLILGDIASQNFMFDALLLKLDENGEEIWSKTYGDKDHSDYGSVLQKTRDNNYIIGGDITKSPYSIHGNIWLIKVDENGTEIWDRSFSYCSAFYSLQQTIDGGYIIAGDTFLYSRGKNDVLLIKTDEYGNMVWNETFGGSSKDIGLHVEQTADKGYIITGLTSSYGHGNNDVWLIKVAPESNPPLKPVLNGHTRGRVGKSYTYTAMTTDPDGDQIYYLFDWGDNNTTEWLGPYNSGETVSASHIWSSKGSYEIRVKAKDTYGMESEWSDPLPVSMPRERLMDRVIQELSHFFPHFFSIYWN